MTQNRARKLPLIEPLSAHFWLSGESGALSIQRCTDCGTWQHPPLVRCSKCHSAALAPQPVSGLGIVKSWTVNHQAWQHGIDPTFVFAVIELAEQAELYVFTNLLCLPDAARSGMDVKVTFEQKDDVWLPLFAPVEAGDV